MKPSNVQDATVQKTVERSFLSDAPEMGDPESHPGAHIPPTVEYSHLSDASTFEDTVVHLARMDISAASTPEDSSFLTEPPEDSSSEDEDVDGPHDDDQDHDDLLEEDDGGDDDGSDANDASSTPTIKREMSVDPSSLLEPSEVGDDRLRIGSPAQRILGEQGTLLELSVSKTFF